MTSKFRRRPFFAAAVTATALMATAALAACGSSSGKATTSASDGKQLTTVTLSLDYLANNAGFAGFYVAQQNGYFKDAGLNVKIEPYTNTTADVLVNAGKADFGTIDAPSLVLDRAAGQKLVSIMAIMQHAALRVAVATKDTDKVNRPTDLNGKTFGGFGVPIEKGINNAMIKSDGATPNYKTVTLGVSVYDALTQGQVDWALIYDTDDIAWAALRNHPWKIISPQKYGVPDYYEKMIFSSDKYLAAHPDIAKRFVAASAKGYEWAAKNPDQATKLQSKLVKGDFDLQDQTATARLLAAHYWVGSTGKVGAMDASLWDGTGRFLYEQGLLKDSAGSALTSAPDTTDYFSNQYLPSGS